MSADLQYVNGVRSNLIEEQIQQQSLPPSADAIIIFGTATRGPLLTPTRVSPSNVESIFGPSISDPYEKFNLVKGFHEINGSLPRADIIAVRVGDAKRARLDLYEHQVASGEAPSGLIYNPQPEDTISVSLEALTDGLDGNNVTVDVFGDPVGVPTRAIITLPNGTAVEFDMVNTNRVPSALAAAINADDEVSQYIKATSNVLSSSTDITITASEVVSGQIENVYILPVTNLLDITAAYIQGEYEDNNSIAAGRSSATLENTPVKDEDENTVTISKFWTIVAGNIIQDTAEPGDVGETSFDLTEAANDNNYDSTDLDNRIKNLVIKYKSGSTGVEKTLVLDTDYTLDGATPAITLIGTYSAGLAVGDRITANYYYLTSYNEANVRSALSIGDPRSYFVGGNTITFGANQTWPVAVAYETKDNFVIPGDVTITDARAGEIRFAINANTPAVGDVITFEYVFEPELPAPNNPVGTLLPSGRRQSSQLSGGTDGRIIDKPKYYNELAKGYIAADNTPFRIVVVQGVYVDDVMEGVDFETGLLIQKNAGFHTQLSTFLARHSIYVSECIGIMSTQPMVSSTPNNPTLEERENWYNRLVNISATDVTRPANIVTAITDYHLVVTTGDFLLQHPAIANGKIYVEGAYNIFAGMKFFHDNLTSIVTREVPAAIVRGMLYKVVAADRINAINAMRYTLITEDTDFGTFKAASAPTMASATSQFRKQYNLDITIEAVNRVRRVLKPFIGQPNKNSVREAMRATAKQELQKMSPAKLMQFDLEILANRIDAINGKVQIDLNLVTAVEISQINIRTRLQLGF